MSGVELATASWTKTRVDAWNHHEAGHRTGASSRSHPDAMKMIQTRGECGSLPALRHFFSLVRNSHGSFPGDDGAHQALASQGQSRLPSALYRSSARARAGARTGSVKT